MSYISRYTHVTLPVGVHVRRAPLFGPHRRVPTVLERRREIVKAVGHGRGGCVGIVVVAVARSVAATAVRVAVGLLLERPPLIRVHRHGTAVVGMDRLFRSAFCRGLWCQGVSRRLWPPSRFYEVTPPPPPPLPHAPAIVLSGRKPLKTLIFIVFRPIFSTSS